MWLPSEQIAADLENMTMDKAKYALNIDQEPFNPENMKMDLVMTLVAEVRR